MFISMLFNVKREAQIDIIYDKFYEKFGSTVRDCRVLNSGSSRYLDLMFKADQATPFISFAKRMINTEDTRYQHFPTPGTTSPIQGVS